MPELGKQICLASHFLLLFESPCLENCIDCTRTKVQNLCSGDPAAGITVANNTIEAVTEFRYLGSIQSSSGRCYSDLHRRIGVAFSAMHSMQRCWRQKGLSLDTKLRLYQTCILQILLYGADTWTLLADNTRILQSFSMSCQCQILGVKWQGHVKNVKIADRTGLPNIADIISKRHQALFGHVVRLDATTPVHQALCQVTAMKDGQSLGMNWRRPPGRPRKTWIQQIGNGTLASWRQMWQSADERGHCEESSQRTSVVYASWWWCTRAHWQEIICI